MFENMYRWHKIPQSSSTLNIRLHVKNQVAKTGSTAIAAGKLLNQPVELKTSSVDYQPWQLRKGDFVAASLPISMEEVLHEVLPRTQAFDGIHLSYNTTTRFPLKNLLAFPDLEEDLTRFYSLSKQATVEVLLPTTSVDHGVQASVLSSYGLPLASRVR